MTNFIDSDLHDVGSFQMHQLRSLNVILPERRPVFRHSDRWEPCTDFIAGPVRNWKPQRSASETTRTRTKSVPTVTNSTLSMPVCACSHATFSYKLTWTPTVIEGEWRGAGAEAFVEPGRESGSLRFASYKVLFSGFSDGGFLAIHLLADGVDDVPPVVGFIALKQRISWILKM